MYKKALEKLSQQEQRVEEDIKKCEEDIYNVSNLGISVATFCNLLSRSYQFFTSHEEEENNIRRKKFKEFKQKEERYKKIIKDLNKKIEDERVKKSIPVDIETKNFNNVTDNTIGSYSIREDSYNENSLNENIEDRDDSFYSKNKRRLNSFIITAIDSLDNLQHQRSYIDNTRDKIRNALSNLGMSDRLIDSITRGYLTDYYLFMAGVGIVLLLFILIKYFT